ncbi:AtpZ/AtpI family protein [Marivita sp. GX14005]|uniref:AtpZ/AtpI family protein n=1 Tax=Marivita sp. GX14005 TaxID=2942276 RepID=UPI002018B98B|nr:AtpZ/AtpI family protein [Marivita sp. GX14005]MCL3882939.1 AtpZ/AtpI family protein [Marivita sp. GX14005]
MSEDDKRRAERIGHGARRMKTARDDPAPSPLRGIGTFGMVGWSVAVPTVGGALLGFWLDRTLPQDFSWTLALLLAGVVIGGLIAWGWIDREGGGK